MSGQRTCLEVVDGGPGSGCYDLQHIPGGVLAYDLGFISISDIDRNKHRGFWACIWARVVDRFLSDSVI